jgi:WD40 repeat protein
MINAVALGVAYGRVVVMSSSLFDRSRIRLWDGCTGEPIGAPIDDSRHSIGVPIGAIGRVNGRSVGAQYTGGTIRLWDLHAGERIGELCTKHAGAVSAIAVGEVDGRVVVVQVVDGTIGLWDGRTGEPIGGTLKRQTSAVNAIALGAIDRRQMVISGSYDGTIRLWDARSQREQFAIELGTPVTSIAQDREIGIAVVTLGGLFCIELREAEGQGE